MTGRFIDAPGYFKSSVNGGNLKCQMTAGGILSMALHCLRSSRRTPKMDSRCSLLTPYRCTQFLVFQSELSKMSADGNRQSRFRLCVNSAFKNPFSARQ